MIDIVNALTGDVLTSVDLDETLEVLPQLRVHFWQEFCRPPFSVAFTSGHNMLHDSAVLRDIDPMNGIAAALLPIASSWARDLEEAVRCDNPHETVAILKRGQDPKVRWPAMRVGCNQDFMSHLLKICSCELEP